MFSTKTRVKIDEDEPTKDVTVLADGSVVTAEDSIQQVLLFCTFEERCLLRTLNKTWKNATDSLMLRTALEQVPLANEQLERHSISVGHDFVSRWGGKHARKFALKKCKELKYYERIKGNPYTSGRYVDDNGDKVFYIETDDFFDPQLFLSVREKKQPQWLECEEDDIKRDEARWLQRISFGLQRNGGKVVQAWRVTCRLNCEIGTSDDHEEWNRFRIFLFQVPDGREVEMIVCQIKEGYC